MLQDDFAPLRFSQVAAAKDNTPDFGNCCLRFRAERVPRVVRPEEMIAYALLLIRHQEGLTAVLNLTTVADDLRQYFAQVIKMLRAGS